jgi:putative nucleotidyltransferase with HDIG domain
MKEILMVSTEPSLRPGVLECSQPFRKSWNLTHVGNGTQGIELLESNAYDAVVVDLELPDGNGTKILDEARRLRESALRFIVADLSDPQMMMKCAGTSHQFLPKSCDGAKLEAALERARQIDHWIGREKIQQLCERMRKVPSPPSAYFQIIGELRSPAASMGNIAAIISRDRAMTAKLLHMVNSPVFDLQGPVSTPEEALMFLGIETTKSLVLLAHTCSFFDRIPGMNEVGESLWRHSLVTGRLARIIARAEKAGDEVVEQAFTAGLLHDIGKLILAGNQPEQHKLVFEKSFSQSCPAWQVEKEIFGLHHGEVGAWLAATWSLPLDIIEALALHHEPTRTQSAGINPLTVVHVASVIESESRADTDGGGLVPSAIDESYLRERGLEARLHDWRALSWQLMSGKPFETGPNVNEPEELLKAVA